MGKFIAIDGLDGSGKGTQSEKLVEYLKSQGKKVRVLSFPVYENDTNNIIGILNVKDLILEHSTTEQINLRKILRPFIKFNYNEKIDDVFRYMQQTKNNISIIYDNSNFIGIVTLEDAIEEIVGNIYDEFDTNN